MATSSSSLCQENEKLEPEYVTKLATKINSHVTKLLSNPKAWISLKLKCISKLNIESKKPSFEFSDQSIVSNLYWGIEAIDAAARAKTPGEMASKLQSSEKMLQVPASLMEEGQTSGIPNEYIICCSYFYLSVVRNLQRDVWQVALHFLQALAVSPAVLLQDFAPKLCRSLMKSDFRRKRKDFDGIEGSKVLGQMAKEYKTWFLYYQIMSVPGEKSEFFKNRMSRSSNAGSQFTNLQECYAETTRSSSIKCLKDMLIDSQSDATPVSAGSSSTSSAEETFSEGAPRRRDSRIVEHFACRRSVSTNLHKVQRFPEETFHMEQVQILEKMISNLCFSETLGNIEEDYTIEVSTVYKLLNNRRGLKYSLLRDIILDQLLMAISNSEKDQVIRASVTILSTIISGNEEIVDDIKKKGLQLHDLASALRRNVHEASVLIYLINPSPEEMKTLEILPCLAEVVCTSDSYKHAVASVRITPRAASLRIIDVLISAFDFRTNNMHLSVISSPRVLSGLLDHVPGNDNLDEFISLAAILVKCMQFDGQCRQFIAEFSPLSEILSLLRSNQKRASSTALEFLHELLRMPRSSAVKLLKEIRKDSSSQSMNASSLLCLIQTSLPEQRLLAASLILQLDMLDDMYQEEAIKTLLESLSCEESPSIQALSAFTLSNLGGTYSWTGEPYTIAWLAKKAGLTSLHHKNMIKNYDFCDECLQDAGIEKWCSKLARRILKFGIPVFHHLVKGLNSKSKRISRDCLTTIAWIGCEVGKSGDHDLRYGACEILLGNIEQYVHPGIELEERLLACLCIYNYTLGRGMKKLIHFSEGVRESLRRLANVSWMAEELLKVADYFQPDKWRISCVHTQTLEIVHESSGAVTALIFYRGMLCSGYADGSIKVWDIKGHTATLVQEMKIHNKSVACFSLLEQGNCLLSGSADKTIKIWRMAQQNLECIEVITTKDSIERMDTYGELIFTISRGHKMKVLDSARNGKDVFKNKSAKSIKVVQGKVYVGCMDSSIQELGISTGREQEIRAPGKKWMMQNKPVNSLSVYKDWLYGASVVVEGSKIKDWRRNIKPQVSVSSEKGANVLALEVVEDFIYLNTSASRSNLQIWLRGTLHKVGRLSAGNKITSLMCANDMILCGTETGMIKGWIPL